MNKLGKIWENGGLRVGTLDSYKTAERLGYLEFGMVWSEGVCACRGAGRRALPCHLVSREQMLTILQLQGTGPYKELLCPKHKRAFVEKLVEETLNQETQTPHSWQFCSESWGSSRESWSNLCSAPDCGIFLARCCCLHLSPEISESMER